MWLICLRWQIYQCTVVGDWFCCHRLCFFKCLAWIHSDEIISKHVVLQHVVNGQQDSRKQIICIPRWFVGMMRDLAYSVFWFLRNPVPVNLIKIVDMWMDISLVCCAMFVYMYNEKRYCYRFNLLQKIVVFTNQMLAFISQNIFYKS